MNYLIDPTSSEPAYLQLYHALREDIISGVYPYGSRLPSKRTIAADTGLSVIPVEHALALLGDEGYIEPRERSGCFVSYREADFQSSLNGAYNSASSATALNLRGSVFNGAASAAALNPRGCVFNGASSAAGPDFSGSFPFSVLARTMRKVLNEYGSRILIRGQKNGCPELRAEISAYLARSRHIQVRPERIVVGAGAEYLYSLIAQLFGIGRTFALENPSYEKIRLVYASLGIHCDLLPLTENGIASAALAGTEASVLHVTPFHSYPSGISADISKKKEYLSWAKAKTAYLVEDNYDSELTISRKAEDTLFSMSGGKNVIYINTFSKTISPSMRIGYMILPDLLADVFFEKLGFYACTVPLFDQYVLAELLRSGDYERHINRVRRRKRQALKT